jgi:site-specific DNA-methyltransferase (adenine-specific)/adenine-specific DNA-methyltransferase
MAELVWKGKHSIAQQNARDQAICIDAKENSQQLLTCETFDGQPVQSPPNSSLPSTQSWHNRLILGDKNVVLPALLSEFTEQVNLIYIDPPFMTGRDFISGSKLAFSDKWDNNIDAYIQWLYETFVLLKLLLAPHGSLYVHLDWRVSHYARVILDEIFGFNSNTNGTGFQNEIIWHYQSGGRSLKRYARKHDTILFYSKSAQYCFHGERIGELRGQKKRNHMKKNVDTNGRIRWTIRSAGRLYSYDEDTPMTPADVWNDISHLHQRDPERNGFATQKPTALLERLILASSEENDLVLDCFCGSGVTPTVAEQLGRRWIASDQSELALAMTRERLLRLNHLRPFVLQRITKETGESSNNS